MLYTYQSIKEIPKLIGISLKHKQGSYVEKGF